MGIDIPTTGEFGNCSLIGDINKKLQLKLKGIDKEKKDYYKNLLSKSCFFINNPNKNTIHNRNLSRE